MLRFALSTEFPAASILYLFLMQPILIAAAIDYEIISGRRHGDLAEKVETRIRLERRQEAQIDPTPPGDAMVGSSFAITKERSRQSIDGATIVVGRSSFKEYLQGLHSGWTQSLQLVDKEAVLAEALSEDAAFDELEADEEKQPEQSRVPVPSPLQWQPNPPKKSPLS